MTLAPAPPIQLPALYTPPIYGKTLGGSVIDFAEQLPVIKGPQVGEDTHLQGWQQWLYRRIYEVRPDNHLRYRRGLVGVARQNGKGFVGSRAALHALIRGPGGSEVYSAAGDRKQAKIVFDEARRLCLTHPYLSEHCNVYRDVIEVPTTGSIYRALSADAGLSQGLSPFFTVFDEIHIQPNEELWEAITMGMGARPDAMVLGITTAGFDIDSLAGRLYDYGKRIISGEEEDPAFGMWWWEPASPDVATDDREAWRAANPSLAEGVMLEEDMEAAERSSREAAFRRFRLNQWVPLGGEQWMPPHLWDAAKIDFEPPPEDTPIVVGFDGSVSRDATAVVAIDLERRVMWPVRIWEPSPTDMDWQVPRDEVDAELHGLFARYDVRAFGGDPAWWRGEMQEWEEQYAGRVYQWPTTNSRMAAACNTMFAWITSGTLRHNGDPTLRRHMLNAIVKDLGPLGDSIKKIKRESKMWIDGAVAAVIATDMAERFGAEVDTGLYTF